MQVRHVPALTGWRWVTEGFSILARSPSPLIAAGILMLFTLLLASVLPVVGWVLPLLLSPALSFGYLQTIRRTQEGKRPAPWTLYSGLRRQSGQTQRSLLILGAINAAATSLVLLATQAIDDGQLLRMLSADPARTTPAVGETDSVYAALIFAALYIPIQVSLWYAPLFAGLHRTPPFKSLVFSFVAVWRNKSAFVVFFIGWFVVTIGLSIVIRMLSALLPSSLGTLLLMPALVMLTLALYCSFWPTYRDTIEPIAVDPAI